MNTNTSKLFQSTFLISMFLFFFASLSFFSPSSASPSPSPSASPSSSSSYSPSPSSTYSPSPSASPSPSSTYSPSPSASPSPSSTYSPSPSASPSPSSTYSPSPSASPSPSSTYSPSPSASPSPSSTYSPSPSASPSPSSTYSPSPSASPSPSSTPTPTPTPTPSTENIYCSLSASDDNINKGRESLLTWNNSSNIVSAVLSPNEETVSSNSGQVVQPSRTTTYTLTVRNALGNTASCSETITVTIPTPPKKTKKKNKHGKGGGRYKSIIGTVELNIKKYIQSPSGEFIPAENQENALPITRGKNTLTYKVVVENTGNYSPSGVTISDIFSGSKGVMSQEVTRISGAKYNKAKSSFVIPQKLSTNSKYEFTYTLDISAYRKGLIKNLSTITGYDEAKEKSIALKEISATGNSAVAYLNRNNILFNKANTEKVTIQTPEKKLLTFGNLFEQWKKIYTPFIK